MVERLEDLPNIGPVLAGRLRGAGIHTPAALKRSGSVEAALRVRSGASPEAPCRNMLCALEGAIRGVRWHRLSKADRDALWQAYVAAGSGKG